MLLFIAGAFIWGDLLATVGDISISKNLRKKRAVIEHTNLRHHLWRQSLETQRRQQSARLSY